MNTESFEIFNRKVIIRTRGRVCETADELLESGLFRDVVEHMIDELSGCQSRLLGIFDHEEVTKADIDMLVRAIQFLAKMPAALVPNVVPGSEQLFRDKALLSDFVEHLYNFWRSYDRFILCDSSGDALDKRPYRTFNMTIEKLTHVVRGTYRDIEENITERHPDVYRQVRAGAEIAAISLPWDIPLPAPYDKLSQIPVIRQILLYPPLILDPPINTRTGSFIRSDINPVEKAQVDPADWLCYPAKVGDLVILVYFCKKYFDLGFALSNLFALADNDDLKRTPDAVYLYGVPGDALDGIAQYPTIFHEDDANGMLAAGVPDRDEFGYFGYLKKMVLTLHNIIIMKRGHLPFHGALVKISLHDGRESTLLLIGDSGAGKSETLEALRELGGKHFRNMTIIADDMGSITIEDGHAIGFGTEIGAFLRLDDLKPGYAFGQMDRAIIMSPGKVNARIVLPVTTFETIIRGHSIDCILYANNYEEIDADHPIIEKFSSAERALDTFREGTVMSKGTTTSTGIVHSYFANIFGPSQYRQLHDDIAKRFFSAFFEDGLFVGQIRTRLGIPGWERTGPKEAAFQLLSILTSEQSK